MTNLHPHWQATDHHNENIRILPKNITQKSVPRASRRPAALTGVVLFIIAGFAAIHGFTSLGDFGAQVDAPVTITIRASGASPASVTVNPGQTISWVNSDTIPHILTSDTFPTSDGKPFTTPAIFPGSKTHILVPLDAKAGTYTYISQTSQTVTGEIIIRSSGNAQAPVVTASSAASTLTIASSAAPLIVASSAQSQNISAAMIITSQASSAAPIAVVASSSSSIATVTQTTTANVIPVNPHTVGTVPTAASVNGYQYEPAINGVSGRPSYTAESGPTTWVVIAITIGGVLFLTRKMFRKA